MVFFFPNADVPAVHSSQVCVLFVFMSLSPKLSYLVKTGHFWTRFIEKCGYLLRFGHIGGLLDN